MPLKMVIVGKGNKKNKIINFSHDIYNPAYVFSQSGPSAIKLLTSVIDEIS